jgi:hypothetical protein
MIATIFSFSRLPTPASRRLQAIARKSEDSSNSRLSDRLGQGKDETIGKTDSQVSLR